MYEINGLRTDVWRRSFLGFLLLFLADGVWAEPAWNDYLDVDLNYRQSARLAPEQRWDFRVGAGVEREPTFQGSNDSDAELDPFIVAAYRRQWGNLFLTGGGLGYSRMLNENLGLMLQLESEDTREESDDARLRGLGNQSEELELEILAQYFLGQWRVGTSLALATGDKGLVWFVGGGYSWRLAGGQLFINLNVDLSGSDKKNQRTDFGITATQSAASVAGFPEYVPGGGLKSVGLGLSADYALSERLYLNSAIEFENLLGDVADSPLVTLGGSDTNLEVSIGVYYRF